MMNRETTEGPASRSELARRATDAVERLACDAGRELDRHAGGYGLSDAKLEVLEVLCCHDERRACLHALGDELGVTRPNVTKLVDGLERGGLVERLPHPSDGRMVHAHLTPQGAEIAGEALPGRHEPDAPHVGRPRRRAAGAAGRPARRRERALPGALALPVLMPVG